MAFGPDGNLYVASPPATVKRYDGVSGSYIDDFVPFLSGGLLGPRGLAFGPDGNLYVGCTADDTVKRYDGTTGAPLPASGQTGATFIPHQSGGLRLPSEILFGRIFGRADYDLYVASDYVENGFSYVFRYDAQTGAPRPRTGQSGARFAVGVFDGWQLQTFRGLALGAGLGRVVLYVSCWSPSSVAMFDADTGLGLGWAVPPNAPGVAGPYGLAVVDSPGWADLYVASQFNNVRHWRIDWSAGSSDMGDHVVPDAGYLEGPTELAFGPDANLYVGSLYTNQVKRYDGSSGFYIDDFATNGDFTGIREPYGLALDAGGNVFACSNSPFTTPVKRFDGGGAPLPAPGRTGATFVPNVQSSRPYIPRAALIGPGRIGSGHQDLYVSGYDDNNAGYDTVQRYDGTTGDWVSLIAAGGVTGLRGPEGLLFRREGTYDVLYVASRLTDNVKRWGLDIITQAVTYLGDFVTAGSGGLSRPTGLAFDGDGNLYVSSSGDNSVKRYNVTGHPFPADGQTGANFVAPGAGGISTPWGLTFGPDGNLYVCSKGDNSVKRYDASTGAFMDNFVAPGSAELSGPFYLLFVP